MSVINNITKALDATLKNEKITLYDLNTADIENISAPGSRINGTEFVASESTFLFVVSGNEVNQNSVSNTADNKYSLVIPGPDTIVGSSGNDAIVGGDGNDRLLGGNGDDLIIGFGGDDILTGNQGRDRFSFERTARENGHDFITDYELEVDKLDFSATESKIIVRQSDNDKMDNLHTFRAGDLIVLNFNNNAANDNIKAIVLPSIIDGSQGEDTIVIQGSLPNSSVYGVTGNDTIEIQGSPNSIIASAGNDTISIIAHNGNDIIVIQDSVPNSTIDSGGGNDTIVIERADLVKKYIHSPDGNDSITAQQKSDVINGYNTGEVQGTEFQGGLVGSAAAEISKGFNKEFSKEIKLIHAEIYGKSLNKEAQTIPQNMIDNAGNIFKITAEETFIGKEGEGNQISTTDNASITPNIFASLLKEISDKTLSSRLDTEFESELLSNGIIKDNEIVIVASNFDNSIIL